jgi:glyoxylase-like metal-dependent hydrolase (beta-lactamase superfamily II)
MKTNNTDIEIDIFFVAPDVWGMKDIFVNMYVIANSSDKTWVLVDAGLKWSAPKIKKMAEQIFGKESVPSAIILTHGHFDHVGSLAKLVQEWDVPVYAHHLEMPYLTGVSSYPPPDSTVGGGLMADLAFAYPKGPINLEERLVDLPEDGSIPVLPEWRFIHTPGHSPGHISLFRDSDKVLVAGDAIVTTRQESALSLLFQSKKLSGPPKYFTCDWLSAGVSVEHIDALNPNVVATGHGRPMRGEGMRKSLHNLVRDFEKVAVPGRGRYVYQPALTDESGILYLPPKNENATAPILRLLGITAFILIAILLFSGKKKKNRKKEEVKKPAGSKLTLAKAV